MRVKEHVDPSSALKSVHTWLNRDLLDQFFRAMEYYTFCGSRHARLCPSVHTSALILVRSINCSCLFITISSLRNPEKKEVGQITCTKARWYFCDELAKLGMDEDRRSAGSPDLRENAITSVTSAITRGRKRRAHHYNVASGDIRIGPTTAANAEQLAERGAPTSAKRRRTTLILGNNSESDDDSNDEWEEHVDMDEDKVAAALETLKSEKEERQISEEPKAKTEGKLQPGTPEGPAADGIEKSRKERAKRRAARERKKALRRHALHILLSVAHLQRQDAAAGDEDVRGVALSMMEDDTFLSKTNFEESLSRFGLWLRATFRLTACMEVRQKEGKVVGGKGLCSASERAVLCARHCHGDVLDLVTVVAALVRSQGFRCRIVSALQPVGHQVARKVRTTEKVVGRPKAMDVKASEEYDTVLYGWVEILCPWSHKWMPLDVFDGNSSSDDPIEVIRNSIGGIEAVDFTIREGAKKRQTGGSSSRPRRNLRKKKAECKEERPRRRLSPSLFCHVVAAENGFLVDVTRRYVRNWNVVEKARAKGRLFERVLEVLQAGSMGQPNDEAHQVETAEFDALAADEALPTSVSAIHKHPRYILERHLKKYEFLYPKWPVLGYIKEEPIYLRSQVHLLHTKDRWIRKMRVVIDGTVPLKSVRSMNGKDATVDLFGEWQTEELKIPACVNGKVPRGSHGNVDLWSPEHLPKGTLHITAPYAKMAARKLGIDFAPAMTGFEIRGGRSIPKIEGVVVAADNGDLVVDAARETAQAAFKRQEEKARQEACERWRKLFRTVNAREKIRKKYGGIFEEAGTYEAMQKRDGLRKAREEKYGTSGPQVDTSSKPTPAKNKAAAASSTQTHEHTYDEPEPVEGDTWRKTCKDCGLHVFFEKL